MKRGVELSMNVIIIAAIALVVLVVLVLLVTRAVTQTIGGTGCESKSMGRCISLAEDESCESAVGTGFVSVGSDCAEGETCCFQPIAGDAE